MFLLTVFFSFKDRKRPHDEDGSHWHDLANKRLLFNSRGVDGCSVNIADDNEISTLIS